MTESEKNAGAEIVEVLKTAAEQAEVVLNYLDNNPDTEDTFVEILNRYGELLQPMLNNVVRNAIRADTEARVERLYAITNEFSRLCQYGKYTKEEALALVQLAFK